MDGASWRRILLVLLVGGSLAVSGCVTLNPTVTAETANSPVFESVSVSEPWAGKHVRVTATLRSTPAARNVTKITVIRPNGKPFSTEQIASGQSTVSLSVPTNRNATLVAINTVNSTTIDKLNISTSGNTIF
jgi:starvation-inducible outer membrane lipoprotein